MADIKKDRRRSQRFEVNQELAGQIKPTMTVRVLNISEHGLLIESPIGLPLAGTWNVTVKAPSGPKIIRARVARSRLKMVMQDDGSVARVYHTGLDFTEEYAGTEEVLALISEVCTFEEPAEMTTDAVTGGGIAHAM
jgi:hypothetical protein